MFDFAYAPMSHSSDFSRSRTNPTKVGDEKRWSHDLGAGARPRRNLERRLLLWYARAV